ncbi:MAG TPA: CHRD domain-containing protein [Nitrososphaeraceae archaeon]
MKLQFLIVVLSGFFSVLLGYSALVDSAYGRLDRYWMVLSGDQLSPPVNTDAIGFVSLKFDEDSTRLIYNVNLDNIHNVTGVYLYFSNLNGNYTKVLNLLKEAKESNKHFKVAEVVGPHETTGTVGLGGVTKQDLKGPLKGNSLPHLHKLVDEGKVFVVVHTKDFPNGEIRGNSFVAIDRVFPDLDEFRWN